MMKDALDEKVNRIFAGKVVIKNLVRKVFPRTYFRILTMCSLSTSTRGLSIRFECGSLV